jgi:MerR family transcriptional regulator/heat shock protein HspR
MSSLPLDDENRPLFTVGQVSEMLELQQAFLRRLDDFGVVSPSRSAGRQRRYTLREITVVRYVAGLVDEGMTLTAIRRVLQLEQLVRELEQQVKELAEQRDAAAAQRDSLQAERDALRAALAERDARLARFIPDSTATRGR